VQNRFALYSNGLLNPLQARIERLPHAKSAEFADGRRRSGAMRPRPDESTFL